ncbi:COG4315 family predicted lipoprotein [Streptomyces nymphaeiformis]|uniref:Putative lipoprotein with Yx(FWY)xxD motif n=1 Tax=Streptomyces nymphaeiformis TaxID=2663842 RepID=A0A7W7XB06_9ACTN|nr:hypothetical protein [Streptomyces nymphaeiformis]MBB4980911.1 putative lipoprotein with Yx(FWY)xxD motif [Streptomyces nymphaeiformis]
MRASKALLAVPLALALAACGGGSDGGPNGDGGRKAAGKPVRGATVTVADSGLGSILVDGQGRTLYAFTKDKDTSGSCGTECIAVWPALTGSSPATAGRGVEAGLLRDERRPGGAVHVAYGDWPLYYYVGDDAAGDVNGQGLDGEWFAVSPDGKLVRTAP